LLLAVLLAGYLAASSEAAVFSEELKGVLSRSPRDERLSVILRMGQRGDLALMTDIGKRSARRKVMEALKRIAEPSQKPIRDRLIGDGRVRRITPLWIINGIAVLAEAGLVKEMQTWAGVDRIYLDQVIELPQLESSVSAEPGWNIDAIRAPEIWALGITGRNVVVASVDSGVDYLHPDLGGSWRGGANSWFDPNGEHASPFDSSSVGHGTAVTGIMVGGGASGTAIGVAPGAKWIAVKIFNDSGVASFSAIHQGLQWIMDPDGNPETDDAPHIVNNSWGFGTSAGDCISEFIEDFEALRAAGMAVFAAAGNSGPSFDTSVSPANYPDVSSVGSVDSSSTVAVSSSRGPSACSGAVFPSVVAPGVAVTSADLTFGGTMPLSYNLYNGTSFAAPHMAGAAALLMSAFPGMSAAEIEEALIKASLDLGEPGPDNIYGYGLLDVMEAYVNIAYMKAVKDYYFAILDREPDESGAAWWFDSIKRMTSLCVESLEGLGAVAQFFFQSDEYALNHKDDRAYLIDLYGGILKRSPADWEMEYWSGELSSGNSRNSVLFSFLNSAEFQGIIRSIFGPGGYRPECGMINDFYRGFLSRFPDEEGFLFWRGMLRSAQCSGSEAVIRVCRAIAHLFLESPEYLGRSRTNGEYVEDLYNAILKRGPDIGGYLYWVGVLEDGILTRAQVLDSFLDSPEFSFRVDGVLEAGCVDQ
jgi:bacillopeptidase F